MSYEAPMNLASITAGDFDDNGLVDLAVSGTGIGPISLFSGKGDGTFMPAHNTGGSDQRPSLVAADFDQDGLSDLGFLAPMRSTEKDRAGVIIGVGDGSFKPAVVGPTLGKPYDLVAADFDRDGKIDLAVTQPMGISVLLNRGK